MADHRSTEKQTALVKPAGPRLPDHLPNGGLGRLGIIRGGGVAPRRLRVQILEIGEVDGHPALQGHQGLHPVVAPGVPHRRHREGILQHLAHHVGVVGGVDKVDIVGPLGDELQADLPQALHRDRPAEVLVADLLILTEHTPQGAAGEENGPGPPGAGDGGLLPHVEGGPGRHRCGGHAAVSLSRRFRAQGIALPGTEIAEHRGSLLVFREFCKGFRRSGGE